MPYSIARFSVSGRRLARAVEAMQPIGRRLDRWFHGRWQRLTARQAVRAAAMVAIVLCFTVPPLELIPFASTAPMAAIARFGLAMSLRDGVWVAAGFALAAGAVAGGLWLGLRAG